jgi:hypothetical protein
LIAFFGIIFLRRIVLSLIINLANKYS